MTTLNYCESLEELNDLRVKLEENISRTRSNDKGGQNGMKKNEKLWLVLQLVYLLVLCIFL